jgi:two-component system response regulator QseB
MSVRSPLNRVILNNFLREKFIYYCCTAGFPEGLLALSRREYAHFTGRRRQADWRWLKAGLTKMGFSVDWFTEGKTGKAALYAAPMMPWCST